MSTPLFPNVKNNQGQVSKATGTPKSGDKFAQDVQVLGGLGTLLEGLEYDYIAAAYPSGTVETYTYKSGGSGGTTVATITVTYVDATKAELVSVERT